MELRPAEKLILLMLADVMEHSKTDGDIDPAFVRKVVNDDHAWAINWQYPSLEEGAENPSDVEEVISILNAWRMINQGFSASDKAEFLRATGRTKIPAFEGFDGNNESREMSIANFLVDELGRFDEFKGKINNTHAPTLERYREIASRVKPIVSGLAGRQINTAELISIFKAD